MNIAPHLQLRIDPYISVVTAKATSRWMINWLMCSGITCRKYSMLFLTSIFKAGIFFSKLDEVNKYSTLHCLPPKTILPETVQESQTLGCTITLNTLEALPTVETTLDEIWNLKAGVCQDFAHILLLMFRLLGIPFRYVSGYACPKDSSPCVAKAPQHGIGAEAYILTMAGWVLTQPITGVRK